VPELYRQAPGGIPNHLRVSKVYYQGDITNILSELDTAKSLGDGAAEEWRKGLAEKGKLAMADAARWERWEASMRPGIDLLQVLREYDPSSFPVIQRLAAQSKSAAVNGLQMQMQMPVPTSTAGMLSGKPETSLLFSWSCLLFDLSTRHFTALHCNAPFVIHLPAYATFVSSQTTVASLCTPKYDLIVFLAGPHSLPQPVHTFQLGHPSSFSMPGSQPQQSRRPVRDPHEVEAIRQARKVDIERRCMELDPPIQPNVLHHMDSFQATLQITQPMTDAMWEHLRPRLLVQRETAELAAHQRQEQLAALQATMPFNAAEQGFVKPAREVYDKEYEQAQEPLRKKLAAYADEYVQTHWRGDLTSLDRGSAPAFAAGVMDHVRERYHQDKDAGITFSHPVDLAPQPASASTSTGHTTPLSEPFLSLDNMKHLFDNSIRPHTDRHRRELFLCSGCIAAEERERARDWDRMRPKWFAFEGLIQHFGAKHTTAFSVGNVVVQWQSAVWPDEAPFYLWPARFVKVERKFGGGSAKAMRFEGGGGGDRDGENGMGSGKLLSESPFFSSSGTGIPPNPIGNEYQNGSAEFQPQASSALPTEEEKVEILATSLSELWDSLDGVKDLLTCVRIQTVVHHAALSYRGKLNEPLSLDQLNAALITGGEAVKPLKIAPGLACRLCVAAPTNPGSGETIYYARIRSVKLQNLGVLITHFMNVHADAPVDPGRWGSRGIEDINRVENLIEVPGNRILADLLTAPGMDDAKLALVAAAFPEAFAWPLPVIGSVEAVAERGGKDARGLTGRLLKRLEGKGGKQAVGGSKKKGHARGGGLGFGGENADSLRDSGSPMPEAREDEYDPRRPTMDLGFLAGPQVKGEEGGEVDLAMFDTDLAPKTWRQAEGMGMGMEMNLAPETLAALKDLNSLALKSGSGLTADEARRDRSPSVGRAELEVPLPQPLPAQGPPDIAAILASLTGSGIIQAGSPARSTSHMTTPVAVAAGGGRSGSRSVLMHADPSPVRNDSLNGGYGAGPGAAGAAAWNTEHFEQNRERSISHARAPVPMQAQSPLVLHNPEQFEQDRSHRHAEASIAPVSARSPPASVSPPRYRVLYEPAPQAQSSPYAYAAPPPAQTYTPNPAPQYSPALDRHNQAYGHNRPSQAYTTVPGPQAQIYSHAAAPPQIYTPAHAPLSAQGQMMSQQLPPERSTSTADIHGQQYRAQSQMHQYTPEHSGGVQYYRVSDHSAGHPGPAHPYVYQAPFPAQQTQSHVQAQQPAYLHQQLQSQTIYLDEYGRQIVPMQVQGRGPVDAARAPVQYLAHPYESQGSGHGVYAEQHYLAQQQLHERGQGQGGNAVYGYEAPPAAGDQGNHVGHSGYGGQAGYKG